MLNHSVAPERIFLVLRAEHALRDVTATTRLGAGIPARPPLHAEVQHKCDDRQRPDRVARPALMEVRKESGDVARRLSRSTHEHHSRATAAISAASSRRFSTRPPTPAR